MLIAAIFLVSINYMVVLPLVLPVLSIKSVIYHIICKTLMSTEFIESNIVSVNSTGRIFTEVSFEPCCEKTGLRGFRPGPTQTGLYSHRKWLEA